MWKCAPYFLQFIKKHTPYQPEISYSVSGRVCSTLRPVLESESEQIE